MVCKSLNFHQKSLLARQLLFHPRRYKKRYASLHNQDRKAFIFPNTSNSSLSVPPGIKKCDSLVDFKIRNLRGGFQRRPELISQRGSLTNGKCMFESKDNIKINKSTRKIERIQYELVTSALQLLNDFTFTPSSCPTYPSQNRDTAHDREEKCLQNYQDIPSFFVDIGCGGGYSLKPLTDMGYPCIGVDLDLSGLQKAKRGFLPRQLRKPQVNPTSSLSACDESSAEFSITDARTESMSGVLRDNPLQNHLYQTASNYSLKDCFCATDERCKMRTLVSPAADVVRWDLRHGFPFKPNSFDAAISISFLQWLFYGNAKKQLDCFFSGLRSILCPSGKAVIQFYPQNMTQLESAVHHALPYFHGTVVGDYPHLDRGRKLFMILFAK